MAIFNSYVKLPEGNLLCQCVIFWQLVAELWQVFDTSPEVSPVFAKNVTFSLEKQKHLFFSNSHQQVSGIEKSFMPQGLHQQGPEVVLPSP